MNKKILMGSFEVPGWGGASTSSYNLFQVMRNDGFDLSYLNIIADDDADFFKLLFGETIGNPKGLNDVYTCFLDSPTFFPHPELANLINEIDPQLIVAIGWIAALLMKSAAPKKDLIYVTTGCDQIVNYIKHNPKKTFMTLYDHINGSNKKLDILSFNESKAVDLSDLIITHSYNNLYLYQYFFPWGNGKIYPEVIWFAEWIYKDALDYSCYKKHFDNRDIDIIFIASSWSRPVKNYKLVKKIISNLKNLNIQVIGQVKDKKYHVAYHDIITDRDELFRLLGNSKTIVCPSLYDAAPGILFEASAMGCNIVTSKNCGNWMLCHESLLVEPHDLKNFIDKILLSLTRKYDDNIDFFMESGSYKKLIELISLF